MFKKQVPEYKNQERPETSFLEGGPLRFMMPLHLHFNQKHDDDHGDVDDDDDDDD